MAHTYIANCPGTADGKADAVNVIESHLPFSFENRADLPRSIRRRVGLHNSQVDTMVDVKKSLESDYPPPEAVAFYARFMASPPRFQSLLDRAVRLP